MSEPVALLLRGEELIAELGGGEPFTLFLLTLEHTVAEEEMFLISGTDNTEFAVPFHQFCRPAEEVFPIIATYLVENLVAVFPYDILETVFSIRILRLPEKAHHILLVGTEVDILHGAASYHLIDKLHIRTVVSFQSNSFSHNRVELIEHSESAVVMIAGTPEIEPSKELILGGFIIVGEVDATDFIFRKTLLEPTVESLPF